MSNPGWHVLAVIIAIVIFAIGLGMTPTIETVVGDIDTTGWNAIVAAITDLMPYIFLGGIVLGIIWLWKGRSSG